MSLNYLVRCLFLCLLGVFGTLISVQYVSAEGDYVPDQLIVKYKKGGNSAAVKERLAEKGVPGGKNIPELGLEVIDVPQGELEAILEELSQDPNVEYIEKNYYYEPLAVPNDQFYPNQLYFDVIQAQQAWDLETGNPNVVIAIIDTGFDITHEDLQQGRLLAGCNVAGAEFDNNNCGTDLVDISSHGTGVTGIASADSNNTIGVAGVCWGCSVLPIKTMQPNGSTSIADTIEGMLFAIDYAQNNPDKRVIMNMSFGRVCGGLTQAEADALELAWQTGMLMVAARGNTGDTTVFCPAFSNRVLAVSASTLDDQLWPNSSWNNVDLAAPGESIYNIAASNLVDPPYIPTYGGTSYAAPIVSAVAGLAWSANMALTNTELDLLLRETADEIGDPASSRAFFGDGRINANAAVDYAINPPPPPTPTPTPAPTPPPLPYTLLEVTRPGPNGILRQGINSFEGKRLPGTGIEELYILMVGTDTNGSTPITKGPCAGKVDIGITKAAKLARLKITPDQFNLFQTNYRIGGKYVGDSIFIQAYRQSNNSGNDRCFISEVIPVSVFK